MKKHFRFPAALMLSMLFSAAAQADDMPAYLNFDKFNTPRECSPAEKHAGKTNCHICDADTPNIVLPYNTQNARIPDAVIIPSDSEYSRDRYRNAWNQNTTTSGKPFDLRQAIYEKQRRNGGFIRSGGSASVVLHGYNLTGLAGSPNSEQDPNSLYPLNMRTVCETFRPRYSVEEAARRGDKSGFRGAAVLGIGSAAISAAQIAKFTNPAGNKGEGAALGGAAGDIMEQAFMARKSFVCVEYFTRRDGVVDNGFGYNDAGGKHIVLHKENGKDCDKPLRRFYDMKVSELYCYGVACDGLDNGVNRPWTQLFRFLYLIQNPSVRDYWRTILESKRAAYQRPDKLEDDPYYSGRR